MENKIEILVAGTEQRILQTIIRLLNTNVLWNATGVSTAGEVITYCKTKVYQVVLLGAGLTDAEEQKLSTALKLIHPGIHVILHYGGGSGLLFAEINLALAKGMIQ